MITALYLSVPVNKSNEIRRDGFFKDDHDTQERITVPNITVRGTGDYHVRLSNGHALMIRREFVVAVEEKPE